MIKKFFTLSIPVITLLSCGKAEKNFAPEIKGDLKQWHNVIMIFEGPETGENDSINPFLFYRLNVFFWKQNKKYFVQGYYAGDGNAAETGADSGNKWKVNFCPDDYGVWNYEVSFRSGKNISVSDNPEEGNKIFADGYQGHLAILPSDKSNEDFSSKGRVSYSGGRYLNYKETGEIFLKAGADSPENLLGYQDFDGTYYGGWNESIRKGEAQPTRGLHKFISHLNDWKYGDPMWRNGKGKALIGALNYLASKGMNSVYMITNNVGGDGKDVFPWATYNTDFTRYDVSKLEQWEIVFNHMDRLGLMCHFVTQENENQLLLDSGALGITRKLYYRELIARFSHHLAITWNLGEENGPSSWAPIGQTDRQRRDMAIYFKQHDPYKNFVVIHTHALKEDRDKIIGNLLGFPYLDGIGLQVMPDDGHDESWKWLRRSAQKGRKWVVSIDETGPPDKGAMPDQNDPTHNSLRVKVLWGNLMAGGGGVEWYFGYDYPNNDLNCEDWRCRDQLWHQTKIAIDFFRKYLPLNYTEPADSLVMPDNVYCLAAFDSIYALYIPDKGQCELKVPDQKRYAEFWYDPVKGGELLPGDTLISDTGGLLHIQNHNVHVISQDWALLVRKMK